jgi:hypothetical protein
MWWPGLVAQTYNPSNSGGRDQEDHGLKPAPANSSKRPYLEKTQKKTGGVAQGVGPEFKPYNCQKKKKPTTHVVDKNEPRQNLSGEERASIKT